MSHSAKFDRDVRRGTLGEKFFDYIHSAENSAKVEVKTDYLWQTSGNMALEYARDDSTPTGIRISESQYWYHNLMRDGKVCLTLQMPTRQLRAVADDEIGTGRRGWRRVRGGDGGRTAMLLIPVSELPEALRLHTK